MLNIKHAAAVMRELLALDLTDAERLIRFAETLGYTTPGSTDEERVAAFERLVADMPPNLGDNAE